MPTEGSALASATHIVQQALTPVFLLSGIGTLLNVFAARLGRVADQADALAVKGPADPGRDHRLQVLRLRSVTLEVSVVLAALGGGLTCATVLALFLGELLGKAAAGLLFVLFGGAILLTLCAIAGFVVEMLLAARSVRRAVDDTVGEPGAAPAPAGVPVEQPPRRG